MSTTIKNSGFLIDMDGLLINSENLSKIVFEKMCQQLGCDFTEDYHSKIRGTKKNIWSKAFVDAFQIQLSSDEIADLHTKLLLEELDQSVQLMPGAIKLLDWIDFRSYPKALVTSSGLAYTNRYLSKLKILDRFDEFVTSEDVSNGKPDPEPYKLGAARIERMPMDCFVFEDSVSGVLSGKAAGSTVFGVPTNNYDRDSMTSVDYLLASLEDSITILENMGL